MSCAVQASVRNSRLDDERRRYGREQTGLGDDENNSEKEGD